MNRRGLLQLLGLSPAASLLGSAAGISGVTPAAMGSMAALNNATSGQVGGDIASLQRQLAEFVFDEQVKKVREEYRLSGYGHSLDADLKANKSFSLAAKERIQLERAVIREVTRNRHWLVKNIQQMMGSKT